MGGLALTGLWFPWLSCLSCVLNTRQRFCCYSNTLYPRMR